MIINKLSGQFTVDRKQHDCHDNRETKAVCASGVMQQIIPIINQQSCLNYKHMDGWMDG